MEEVDNLVKILLEDYKAREIFCFGYIQKNIFVFNYGSGPKLSPFQEKLLKAYFESPYFNLSIGYIKLDFDVLKKQILDSYFNVP